jgi:hypothetical protein
MKTILSTLLAAALLCLPAPAQTSGITPPTPKTIHIRLDGGNNVQRDRTVNAPYSAADGHCALNHPYQMPTWQGGWTSFNPGNTMEFDDPPTNTTPYYMGEQNGGVGSDWHTQIGGICPAPNSPPPQGSACILPPLPSNVRSKVRVSVTAISRITAR